MKSIQAAFLHSIEQKLGEDKLLAEEIAEALAISKPEAYKKISGKSMLSMQQIEELCKAYGVNFHINGSSNRATDTVQFLPFNATPFTVKDYINTLEMFLAKIAGAGQKKLSCATDDIPIFHLFKYPELTAFKLHFWELRVVPGKKIVFNFADTRPEVLEQANRIHQLYQTIPSVEIWTKSSLLNTIEQIKYAGQSGILADKEMGRTICHQLNLALQDVEKCALLHSKKIGSTIPFDWYFYHIIGCITYLAETDGDKMAYLRFNTFNNLQAVNGPLCDEVKHWLDGLVQDSTGFSGQGSMQRNKYLAEAYKACADLMEGFS